MCKQGSVVVKSSFGGTSFVGVYCEWQDLLFYVVNVYVSSDVVGKRQVLQEILDLKQQGGQ